ncbi:MAG: type II secretion system F family protein [Armatimonadota bacterium]
MPNFSYAAIDERGREVQGTVFADTPRAASERVREMGYYPTAVSEREAEVEETERRRPGLLTRITGDDLTIFTRQLANLFNAGLPVLRCLDILVDHTENPKLALVLEEVHERVRAGQSLWESLGEHPKAFSPLYVNMVYGGELSGELGPVLGRLADFMEAEQEKRARLKSAMAYPAVLVAAGTGAVFFLMTFLIPRFSAIFADLGRALPTPTVVLLGIADFLGSYWWAVLLGVAGLWLGVRALGRTERWGYGLDRIRMRVPIFGPLGSKIAVARFARTLATLVRGGVPLLQSFEVVRGALGNKVLERAMDEVYSGVREGESIAEPLARTGAFPSLVVNMIAVGEETGGLEEMLNRIADGYDAEIENRTRQLISMLEPLIILVMGVIVGFVVISMLLPIFEMSTAL